jgi:hypothetical protein
MRLNRKKKDISNGLNECLPLPDVESGFPTLARTGKSRGATNRLIPPDSHCGSTQQPIHSRRFAVEWQVQDDSQSTFALAWDYWFTKPYILALKSRQFSNRRHRRPDSNNTRETDQARLFEPS